MSTMKFIVCFIRVSLDESLCQTVAFVRLGRYPFAESHSPGK